MTSLFAREDMVMTDNVVSVDEELSEIVRQEVAGCGGATAAAAVPELNATAAAFISVTFPKDAKTKIGVKFTSELSVKSIEISSILFNSPVRVGHRIVSINNRSTEGLSKRKVKQLIEHAGGIVTMKFRNKQGHANLVASTVIAPKNTVLRPGQSGIRLRNSNAAGRQHEVVVAQIAPHVSSWDTLLNVGDRVLSLNGISCLELNEETCMDIIDSSNGSYTILSSIRDWTGVVVADLGSAKREFNKTKKRSDVGWTCKKLVFATAATTACIIILL